MPGFVVLLLVNAVRCLICPAEKQKQKLQSKRNLLNKNNIFTVVLMCETFAAACLCAICVYVHAIE